jgi:hypothetical protein
MSSSKDETYTVPRFLSFIDWGYLHEAMRVVDDHFQKEIHGTEDRDKIGNLNATCQSLFRAAFVSSFATLEQNLDELVRMDQKRKNISLSPTDLKHRGIKRSLVYANKVLKIDIDETKHHWKDVTLLQELRNHLVHFGPDFSDTSEHLKLFHKLKSCEYVSFNPIPYFSFEQLGKIIELFMLCIQEFDKK